MKWTKAIILGVSLLAFAAGYYWSVKGIHSDEQKPITLPKGAIELANQPPILDKEISTLSKINEEIQNLVAQILPSVVTIETEGAFLPQNFSAQPQLSNRNYRIKGVGAGAIVSKQGHIITNLHVIQDKQTILVTTHAGKQYFADKIGEDKLTDIAVLKLRSEENFTPLLLGNSDEVETGEIVFAFGNPFGIGETVTRGIISAKQRAFGDMLVEMFQTDAAMNPGNSGGPLIDIKGRIIGINTLILSSDQKNPGSVGLGFALPSNEVKKTLIALLEGRLPQRGFLGVALLDPNSRLTQILGLPESSQGAILNEVVVSSPASRAGLENGDLIISIDDKPIKNSRELLNLITKTKPGKKLDIAFIRGRFLNSPAQHLNATVTIEEAGKMLSENPSSLMKKNNPLADLGIVVRDLSVEERTSSYSPTRRSLNGILISDILPGSDAQKVLLPGDIILQANRKPIIKSRVLLEELNKGPVEILIQRANQYLSVRIARNPNSSKTEN